MLKSPKGTSSSSGAGAPPPMSERTVQLLEAAKKGDEVTLYSLFTDKAGEVDIEAKDSKGYTALMLAAEAGHLDCCALLLTKGNADKDAINPKSKRTALHLAVAKRNLPVAKLLVEKFNADTELVDEVFGYTPLLHAIFNNDLITVLWLIAHGASMSVIDKDTLTPLHVAAEGGHIEIARALIGTLYTTAFSVL